MTETRGTPTKEDIEKLATVGYSFVRISDRYNRSARFIKDFCRLYPDLYSRIEQNGKVRTKHNKNFGCYNSGGIGP